MTQEQILAAIDSYVIALRDNIELNEKLPILNCVREIKNRVSKLEKIDGNQASRIRSALLSEFPNYFA